VTTLYGEAEYFLTENTTIYTEVLLNRRETEATGYQQVWSYLYSGDFDSGGGQHTGDFSNSSLGTGVPGGGSSLSADAGWFGEQWFSPTAVTDHNDESAEIDYQRFVLGLRGSLTENWDWDLAYQYSNSDAEYTNDRVFADAIFDNNFSTGSCVGTVSSVRGVPCVDIPWLDPEFLRGNASQEVRDFLYGVETGTTEYKQWSIDGFVTGEAFDLPAGTVGVAVGFHYREDEIKDTPGHITLDPITGESNSWLDDAAGITQGDDSTVAVFAEVDVPIIVDKPGFENLTLNASARYTDVDSFGDDTTWKVGLNWQVAPTFRARANWGTSFRTPALFELFLADQTSFISQRSDPCVDYQENFEDGVISSTVHANCAADPRNLPPDYTGGTITPTVFTGGGLGVLKAETSDSKTFGIIWQPEFADLSISIDYFDIEVKDEVDQLGGQQIVASCYSSQFGYGFDNTEPLCDLFDRSNINIGINNIRDSFINIASQRNRGYDFQAQYGMEIPWGALRFDVDVTRQVEDFQALFEETAEDFNGLVGDPKWVAQTRVTFERDAWTFFWGGNYIGTSSSAERFGGDTITYRDVVYDAKLGTDAVWYHQFSASYEMDNGLRILAGVANAFDKHPPQLTRVQTGTEFDMVGNSLLASQYDPLGRRFFLNLTMTFE
jgi:iron complex outermembrane receptor protein